VKNTNLLILILLFLKANSLNVKYDLKFILFYTDSHISLKIKLFKHIMLLKNILIISLLEFDIRFPSMANNGLEPKKQLTV